MPPLPPCSRVVLVEDDAPFRAYIAGLLTDSGRYTVVAEAGSGEEARGWPDSAAPELAVVDIVLPGVAGPQVARELLARFPRLHIVMLTGRSEDDLVLDSIRAGAIGYVLKGTDSASVVDALDDARAGGAPMSPAIARRVLALMRDQPAAAGTTAPGPGLTPLTPREHDVLSLVATGVTDKEVAARLGISLSAVKQHLANIYAKWRVRSRTEAAIRFTQARR